MIVLVKSHPRFDRKVQNNKKDHTIGTDYTSLWFLCNHLLATKLPRMINQYTQYVL